MQTVFQSQVVLPPAAACMLGYSPAQMSILIENGILDGIRHRVGCDAYYLKHEIIQFCRWRVIDSSLAQAIEFLIGDIE